MVSLLSTTNSNDWIFPTAIWSAVILSAFILRIIITVLTRQAIKQFKLMNYSAVLKHKKAITKLNKFPTRVFNAVCTMVAVSSFEMGNDDDFSLYINMVKSINYTASVYWKCVYTFFREQPDNFEMYFAELNQIAEKDNSEADKIYLQNICTLIKKKNGEVILEEEKSQIQNSSSKTIKQYINE